jgi:Phage tail tube protein, GTA-gp10
MSMINRARGETGLSINGKTHALCLTLGALAQIETALETASLDDLSARLRQLRAADVLMVLEALLMGGGNPLSEAELQAANIDPAQTASAIAQAFSSAMKDI